MGNLLALLRGGGGSTQSEDPPFVIEVDFEGIYIYMSKISVVSSDSSWALFGWRLRLRLQRGRPDVPMVKWMSPKQNLDQTQLY